MPLFECSKCHVVDNTALGSYWWTVHEGKPPLCTECDPEIKRWHGHFERVSYADFIAKHGKAAVQFPVQVNSK